MMESQGPVRELYYLVHVTHCIDSSIAFGFEDSGWLLWSFTTTRSSELALRANCDLVNFDNHFILSYLFLLHTESTKSLFMDAISSTIQIFHSSFHILVHLIQDIPRFETRSHGHVSIRVVHRYTTLFAAVLVWKKK